MSVVKPGEVKQAVGAAPVPFGAAALDLPGL